MSSRLRQATRLSSPKSYVAAGSAHPASLPATRVQFRECASNWVDTPFLQATTFEHEHEHEHEHERRAPNAKRLVRSSSPPLAPGQRCRLGDVGQRFGTRSLKLILTLDLEPFADAR